MKCSDKVALKLLVKRGPGTRWHPTCIQSAMGGERNKLEEKNERSMKAVVEGHGVCNCWHPTCIQSAMESMRRVVNVSLRYILSATASRARVGSCWALSELAPT